LIAKGDLVIQAVDGLKIDVKEVNQQSVSQTIDAMVKADPELAWLKDMEQRGDVDWRQVKEIHDSFKYSHSGLGAGAQLVIAIVVAYFAGPMLSQGIGSLGGATAAAGSGTAMAASGTATLSAVAAGATAGSTVAAGWANVALTAAATGATTNAAVSTINNRGNLGAVLKDVTSSGNLKGYATSAITAGFTSGMLDSAFGVTGDNVNKVTKGFDLSKTSELAKFGSYLGAQGAVQAVAQTAIQGGSLGGNLQTALTGQMQHLFESPRVSWRLFRLSQAAMA
jgi:filamentous hemagglutinin